VLSGWQAARGGARAEPISKALKGSRTNAQSRNSTSFEIAPQNCAASVEPSSAVVELAPPVIASDTASK
jgi:hypothetical protein